MPTEQSVAYDDLYYNAAHSYEYDGKLYSGVAEEQFDDGKLRCRFRFHNGQQHGDAEEYYRTGAKRSVTPYVNGAVHGRTIEWHENGRIHIERDNEYGIMMQSREFDESGTLVNEYSRPDDDPMSVLVRKRRGGS
ncbi:antitoxin component YwqK of YwqJK toxin-antitoxin module [Rhodopirellula rubra]|uniref:Antitoxin component YwqK of YwqJK toxin-antitoxin module n=1 Tax=Aporhodopirellula rubra TaxID=980271 RepID=A0A7W5H9N6_9BACT|nr:hypothetical protein [Aporhodopirellula rubra]MBB3210728.1 antitoxin component YwqK of YwqJK toxin-antitoxin module [Aporhodopirellula rubra]